MRHAVVVTAAGSSCRFNENSDSPQKKEFASLNGHSVLYRAVQPFTAIEGLCAVVVTYAEGTLEETVQALEDLPAKAGVVFYFTEGGATRQQSVFNGLKFLYEKCSGLGIELVSIHDGARPFITEKLIRKTLLSAFENGACAPAVTVSDSLIRKNSDGIICGRIDRTGVCRIQTPQIFRFPDIYEAHKAALSAENKEYTDDTEIYMDFGRKVSVIEGEAGNIKITYRKELC